jgi:hypothetical protein
MRGVIITWLIAEGIIIYRSAKVDHGPPSPGMLLATSGLFVLLAILAEAGPDAAKLATLVGAGMDIAGLMKPGILPGLGGPATAGPAKAAKPAAPAAA